MTTFEDAARKAGPKDWPAVNAAFVDGAVWARDHLAEQEPTEAEARAAGMAIAARVHNEPVERIATVYDALDRSGSYTDQGREALRAAARIRKEQKR